MSEKKPRPDAANKLIRASNRECNTPVLGAFAVEVVPIRHWFGTSLPPLDVILSGKLGKGFPSGRVVELYGDEHAGKTTLGCLIMAETQRAGGISVIFDTESTLTLERARALGIQTNALVRGGEEYLEPILDALPIIARSAGETPCVIFWDTIAGTPSLQEKGRHVGESAFGAHARSLSAGLRRLSHTLAQSSTLLLACNQLKAGGLGKMFATERETEATLGGHAMRFHTHMRVRMLYQRKCAVQLGKSGGSAVIVGDEIRVRVVKDKDGPSNLMGRECVLVLRKIGDGAGTFCAALSCLRTLQNWGALTKGTGAVRAFGKTLTPDAWTRRYADEAPFREGVHRLLLLCRERLLKKAAPLRKSELDEGELTALPEARDENEETL